MTQQIVISAEEQGTRLDRVLSGRFPDMTRSSLQGLIESGAFSKDGKPLKKNYNVCAYDRILVVLPEL